MKKTLWTISAALFFCMAGCGGGSGWKHDQLPETEWNTDYKECLQQSEMQIGGLKMEDLQQDTKKYGELRLLIRECMEAKGYYQEAGRK